MTEIGGNIVKAVVSAAREIRGREPAPEARPEDTCQEAAAQKMTAKKDTGEEGRAPQDDSKEGYGEEGDHQEDDSKEGYGEEGDRQEVS